MKSELHPTKVPFLRRTWHVNGRFEQTDVRLVGARGEGQGAAHADERSKGDTANKIECVTRTLYSGKARTVTG